MRLSAIAAASLATLVVTGCDSKDPAPAPTSAPAAPTAPTPQAAPAPAMIVYTGRTEAQRSVGAIAEDGSGPAVTLSRPGVDTTFVRALPGRRALLAEMSADGSLAGLAAVRVDTAARAALGALPAGQYASVSEVKAEGEAVLVELSRAGSDTSDVFALRAGGEPRLLAPGSKLVAASATRAVVLTKGNLRSVALDGTGALALGPGDGRDKVAEVKGGRVLFTTHAGAGGDVRVATIDGASAFDLGRPDADEAAFALSGERVIFSRRTAAGAALVSAKLDGQDEQVLGGAELDVRPIHVTGEGRVFFGSAQGALYTTAATGGAPRLLDPAAGTNVTINTVHEGQVVYRSDAPHWPALRAARLDGSAVTPLCEKAPEIPFFAGVSADHRVVFYRALAGQLEGGRIFSVKLDGSDRRPVGTTVTTADGKEVPAAPLDQDFEAITPSGRLVLESEFPNVAGSQLVLGTADGPSAKLLTGAGHVRFSAVVE